MKEKMKYLAKLSLTGVYSFLKIALLGTLSTILVTTIEFIILAKSLGQAGHMGGTAAFLIIFLVRPAGAILWYLTCLGSPFLIFMVGNKYSLTKVIKQLVRDKSEGFLYPVLDKLLLKFRTNQPVLIRNTADASLVQSRESELLRHHSS